MHFGQAGLDGNFEGEVHPGEVAAGAGECVEVLRGAFHLFVGQEAADEFGAGVFFGLFFGVGLPWQEEAGFDFDEDGGHEEVFGGKVELLRTDAGDVVQVLLGDAQHGDVEHVDVLLADKVEQQIERALEAAEDDVQGVGGDEEVLGDVGYGLAEYPGDGVFRRPLLRRLRCGGRVHACGQSASRRRIWAMVSREWRSRCCGSGSQAAATMPHRQA